MSDPIREAAEKLVAQNTPTGGGKYVLITREHYLNLCAALGAPESCSHHGPGCADPQPYPAPAPVAASGERCPECGGSGKGVTLGEPMDDGAYEVSGLRPCTRCCGTGRVGA